MFSDTPQGPTVFPILFASVFGRAAQAVLNLRLERGEKIGILDLLAGSTSLTNTVMSQFRLRTINALSVCLITAWLLSPLGGQASIRLLDVGQRFENHTIWSIQLASRGELNHYRTEDDAAMARTAFHSAMIAPSTIKSSSLDPWNNVKIPRIEPLEQRLNATSNGWYFTNRSDDTWDSFDGTRGGIWNKYSSLTGIPIKELGFLANNGTKQSTETFHMPQFVNYSLSIQTNYFNTECTFNQWEPVFANDEVGHLGHPWSEIIPESDFSINGSVNNWIWWSENSTTRKTTSETEVKPFNFSWAPTSVPWSKSGYFGCNITTTYVQALVECPTWNTCAVSRMRRSLMDQPSSSYTQLDSPRLNADWSVLFKPILSFDRGHRYTTKSADASGKRVRLMTVIEDSIEFPGATAAIIRQNNATSPQDYATRLGQLLTTYWACMNSNQALVGGLWYNGSAYRTADRTWSANEDNYNASKALEEKGLERAWDTLGNKNRAIIVVKVRHTWVAILCTASLVLILASLVPPIIRHFFAQGPDVMMNVSSLATRSNGFVPLPPSGTFLDASDRSRALRDVRIRLGDVNSGSEVGALALVASSVPGALDGMAMRKGRLYE